VIHGCLRRLKNYWLWLSFLSTPSCLAAIKVSVRKAIASLRKVQPDVIVADFYFQSDFRDRLSNLESLLAAAQPMTQTKILVLYEPHNQAALDKVRSRLRIDAALTMPVKEAELQAALEAWLV
jgi:DNA-binding NarL/FixJ family response regulator